MVTDNPRAVDDSSIQTKDQLNRVVFYVSALIILIFSLTTILFNDFSNHWVSFCPSKRWGDQGGKVMIGRQGGRVSTALS